MEVALDRFIDEQVDDGSEEATGYAARARIVKFLMQAELEVQHGN